jgi:hypothetical protein
MGKSGLAFLAGIALMLLLGLAFQHRSLVPVAVALLPDGAVYEGDMQDGLMHGEGILSWANGVSYSGEFVDGLFQGKGHYQLTGGVIYDGEFSQGEIHGYGVMVFSPDRRYEGEFAHDQFAGSGTYTTERETYTGEFRDDLYHGQGTLSSVAGSSYTGSFEAGEFHGEGLYTAANGDTWSGLFENGELNGPGSYVGADGGRYVGELVNWKFHGEGTYTKPEGDQYIGEFVDGEFRGNGQYAGADGSRYRGQFKDWAFHGEGILRMPRGDAYKGEFRYGQFHGPGTLSYARPLDGRAFVIGEWRAGRMIKSDDPALILAPEVLTEVTLYNQHELLAKHFGGLLDSDDDRPNMYLLGVAGDGTQAVFRREVLYVKDLMDQQFDTSGRSLVLINGKQTVRKFPLATQTSLDKSLAALAARMNPEQDILFVYLSSHGTEDYKLVLDQSGMSIRNLPAKSFAAALNKLPIRWKVVVVSACYAGGFVPELADENTLVITSAAADRNSFGCSDLADFSYFGEAFFKQGLAHGTDLVSAFEQAATRVAEREEAEGYIASQPQIHQPEPILVQLQKWREALPAADD